MKLWNVRGKFRIDHVGFDKGKSIYSQLTFDFNKKIQKRKEKQMVFVHESHHHNCMPIYCFNILYQMNQMKVLVFTIWSWLGCANWADIMWACISWSADTTSAWCKEWSDVFFVQSCKCCATSKFPDRYRKVVTYTFNKFCTTLWSTS
jgi:hypothetical protein